MNNSAFKKEINIPNSKFSENYNKKSLVSGNANSVATVHSEGGPRRQIKQAEREMEVWNQNSQSHQENRGAARRRSRRRGQLEHQIFEKSPVLWGKKKNKKAGKPPKTNGEENRA